MLPNTFWFWIVCSLTYRAVPSLFAFTWAENFRRYNFDSVDSVLECPFAGRGIALRLGHWLLHVALEESFSWRWNNNPWGGRVIMFFYFKRNFQFRRQNVPNPRLLADFCLSTRIWFPSHHVLQEYSRGRCRSNPQIVAGTLNNANIIKTRLSILSTWSKQFKWTTNQKQLTPRG